MGHNSSSNQMGAPGSLQGSNRNGGAKNQVGNTNDGGQLITERSGLTPLNQAHSSSHHGQPGSANGFQNGSQLSSQNNNYRNENILCAVLALLKELDESGLELVKRDIDRKL